jgi:FkbM family methyltransferase
MQHKFGWAFPDDDDFMAHEIQPDGTYQLSHYRAAMTYVRNHDLAIDGGAHVGTWTRLMSVDFTQVIAVEPSADSFAALTENMQTFECTNVDLRHVALGSTPGHVSMVIPEGRATELRNTGARCVMPGTDVPQETIDAWQLPSLGFLKLDVEGSEPFVLEGARETVRRCQPVVLFEDKGLWQRYACRRDAPHQLLRSLGYVPAQRVSMDEIWVPHTMKAQP